MPFDKFLKGIWIGRGYQAARFQEPVKLFIGEPIEAHKPKKI
jgi:hypothetical protein